MAYAGSPQVEITCICGCGRKRLVRAGVVKAGNGKFFSIECRRRYIFDKKKRPCAVCGKIFAPKQCQIDNGTGKTCSDECRVAYGAGQFKKGNPGRTNYRKKTTQA